MSTSFPTWGVTGLCPALSQHRQPPLCLSSCCRNLGAVPNDAEFLYSDLLPTGKDDTPYRLITTEGVSTFEATAPDGSTRTFLQVEPDAIRKLTSEAMHDISHYLRPAERKPPSEERVCQYG